MNCPRCTEPMGMVCIENTMVDRCTGCGGIWFDKWETEDRVEAENDVSVDIERRVNKLMMGKIRDIHCPRCGKQMLTAVDREDLTLKFEVCIDCRGCFLDAGELRDMAYASRAEITRGSLFGKLKQFIFAFDAIQIISLPQKTILS